MNSLSLFGALKLTVCLRGLISVGVFSYGMAQGRLMETWISGFPGLGDRRDAPSRSRDTPVHLL